jgi:glycosyltransferase involved in cell wall biosynthesis
MTKLTIVLHDLRGGGAEKMMVRLANQMAEDGDEVSMILITGGGENTSFLSSNVKLVELHCYRTLKAFWPLRRALKAEQPDAILAALTHINVISAAACFTLGWLKRLSVSERNAFSLDKKVNSNKVMRVAYLIAPWIYRMLPRPVICVSQGVADDLVVSTVVRSIDVVTAPNPVITQETISAAKEPAQHPWLVKKETPVIIAIGRLSYQKGFDMLIDAFSQVNKQVDCRLIIFGDGELRSTLQSQVSSLGLSERISMPGYVINPLSELKAADVYVLSSRFEGSPNAIVEAMSVGTPVVAFDCPHGTREILQNGKVGALVEHLNVEVLCNALVSCLQHTDEMNSHLNIESKIKRFFAKDATEAYRKLLVAKQ